MMPSSEIVRRFMLRLGTLKQVNERLLGGAVLTTDFRCSWVWWSCGDCCVLDLGNTV